MICVLLATYRPDATMLSEQVESIRTQTDVAVKLISREDPDGAGAMANFAALLREADGEVSDSDYIALADQDDVWMPQKLSRQMAKMREMEAQLGKNTPILVFCDAMPVDKDLNPLGSSMLAWQGIDVEKGVRLPRLLMQNFISGNMMLMNAALLRKAGPVPADAIMHDSWIALVAAAFGKLAFVPEVLVKYRQHSKNVLGGTKSGMAHVMRRWSEGALAFRERLALNVRQAAALVERFGDESPACAKALAAFPAKSWLGRRLAIVRNGLWKHGFCRNLALMLWS